jgi:monoamine oxidase
MRLTAATSIVSFVLIARCYLPCVSASPAKAGAPCLLQSNVTQSSPDDVDVAIVGGGFSGMASAYRLHKAGLKVVVLEATNKLGGRSRSHPLQAGPGLVELGATWINNLTQPSVSALTQDFGIELVEQYTNGYSRRQLLDGSTITEVDVEEGDEDFVEDMVRITLRSASHELTTHRTMN